LGLESDFSPEARWPVGGGKPRTNVLLHVEGSTNLTSWSVVTNVVVPGAAAGQSNRVFRLRIELF
jgi:hypothetical protein